MCSRRLHHIRGHIRPFCTSHSSTHDVLNQAAPLEGYNAYSSDPALAGGVDHHGGSWGFDRLSGLGAAVGSAEWQRRARDANSVPPRLETHDRFGHRRDAADFHPAYHELMALGLEAGASTFAWERVNRGRRGAHVIRGALMYLMYQLNPGVCCPITMTFAATPALEAGTAGIDENSSSGQYLRSLMRGARTPLYDGGDKPHELKEGITLGMSMTEKQGGSDVRANTTVATPIDPQCAATGDEFALLGHKWFTSAPMSDVFLTLAKTKEGVSCFLVPRWLPGDRGRNAGFQLQRLKDKMGDKSNASSEVEYRGARGWLLGEPGRGVRCIVDMVVHTRIDCVIGSAALMRQCSQLAVHHCSQRCAFGRPLLDQPLMRAVLADLAIESEAAVALWLRLTSALDRAAEDAHEAKFIRLATAISKYWVCKRAPLVAYEAMECHGGNGYVEESPTAALFRQSPLNAIWEGSGNVICLDVLRAASKEPESVVAFFAELDEAVGAVESTCASSKYGETVRMLKAKLLGASSSPLEMAELEFGARRIVDSLAVCLQAATLVRHGDAKVAGAFLATRLPASGANGGCLPFHSMGAVPGSLMGSVLSEDTVSHLIERLLVSTSHTR